MLSESPLLLLPFPSRPTLLPPPLLPPLLDDLFRIIVPSSTMTPSSHGVDTKILAPAISPSLN